MTVPSTELKPSVGKFKHLVNPQHVWKGVTSNFSSENWLPFLPAESIGAISSPEVASDRDIK